MCKKMDGTGLRMSKADREEQTSRALSLSCVCVKEREFSFIRCKSKKRLLKEGNVGEGLSNIDGVENKIQVHFTPSVLNS